jgi:hypothetical protein
MRMPSFLLPLALALPLGAQGFEGTLSMRIGAPDGTMMDAKYALTGDMMGVTMIAPASAGPLAGSEIRMIINNVAKTMTMLMPIPAGMGGGFLPPDAKGIKQVSSIASYDDPMTESSYQFKATGTSQVIAGLTCKDWQHTQDNVVTNVCLATGMGKFTYPSIGGGMGGRGRSSSPAWTKLTGTQMGFPLKVWEGNGKVVMEVTAVDRAAVPISAFETPAGYVDLGGMMGGGRRP